MQLLDAKMAELSQQTEGWEDKVLIFFLNILSRCVKKKKKKMKIFDYHYFFFYFLK